MRSYLHTMLERRLEKYTPGHNSHGIVGRDKMTFHRVVSRIRRVSRFASLENSLHGLDHLQLRFRLIAHDDQSFIESLRDPLRETFRFEIFDLHFEEFFVPRRGFLCDFFSVIFHAVFFL